MDRTVRQCNPVQGVAFGQTPTVEFQLGPRYRWLMIEAIATAAAAKTLTISDLIADITIKIGGNPQRVHSAGQLDAINASYGAQYGMNTYNYDGGAIAWVNGLPQGPQVAKQTVFYLPIFFREPWRSSYSAKEMMAWPTAWSDGSVLPSFTMELQLPNISANVLAGNVPIFNVYAETDTLLGSLDANKNPIANITKWKRQGLVYSGAGDLVVTNLNKREVYNQISLFCAYCNGKGRFAGQTPAQQITDQNDLTAFDYISRAKIEVDNRTVRDTSKTISDQGLCGDDFNEAALPADRLDIVFDKSDLPTDGLVMEANGNTVKDFRLTATLATGAAQNKTISALMQVYGAIER